MRVAITGATGFIGKRLVKYHQEVGDDVRVLTRKNPKSVDFSQPVTIFQGDLSDQSNILSDFVKDVDVLYHCAAEINDNTRMNEVNINGTDNLIKAAQGNIGHWVQLSSVGIYGPIQYGLVTEKRVPAPNNMYEKTKLISDEKVVAAAAEGKFTSTLLRPSNVFGPDMRNGSLFALIKAVDKGLFFFIGPKGATANYISVENVVKALVLCGSNDLAKGKTYNISDWTTIEDFIKIVAEVLHKPYPKVRFPLPLASLIGKLGDKFSKIPLTSGRVNALTGRAIYVNDSIVSDLGYSHVIPINTAIGNLVDAYKRSKL